MKINRVSSIPPLKLSVTRCSKCGMEWSGAMAYVCSDKDCPVQLKAGFDVKRKK